MKKHYKAKSKFTMSLKGEKKSLQVGEEKDDYEPDYDAINDRKKLEEEEELDSRYLEEVKEHDCCRGDCK